MGFLDSDVNKHKIPVTAGTGNKGRMVPRTKTADIKPAVIHNVAAGAGVSMFFLLLLFLFVFHYLGKDSAGRAAQ
jgi:hypothetical protein